MKTFFDIVIPIGFILFMVYIFAGYHKSRRDADIRAQQKQEEEK